MHIWITLCIVTALMLSCSSVDKTSAQSQQEPRIHSVLPDSVICILAVEVVSVSEKLEPVDFKSNCSVNPCYAAIRVIEEYRCGTAVPRNLLPDDLFDARFIYSTVKNTVQENGIHTELPGVVPGSKIIAVLHIEETPYRDRNRFNIFEYRAMSQ